MPDDYENKQDEKYSFLQETVKDEQIKPKKMVTMIFRLAGKGLVFGLAACLAFCGIKPWVEAIFARNTDVVTIPEDEEPEVDETTEEPTVQQEFTVENYREMSNALTDVAKEAYKSVVTVEMMNGSTDLESLGEQAESVSGVIVWKNLAEVLIVAPSRILDSDGTGIVITFNDGKTYDARLKKQDKNSQLAVFSVVTPTLKDSTEKSIQAATLGNSNVVTKGMPVIAIGNQFGYSGGSGYGIISTVKNYINTADRTYKVLTTDITAAETGSTILFNTDGEVIGIGDQTVTGKDSANLVTGYAISGIKEVIELLSNGNGVPYIGINGVEITEEIAETQGIPQGIYIKGIEADSPAMQAGIQNGDILVSVDGENVKSLYTLGKIISKHKVDERIKFVVQRQGTEEYAEISFNVTVGSKE